VHMVHMIRGWLQAATSESPECSTPLHIIKQDIGMLMCKCTTVVLNRNKALLVVLGIELPSKACMISQTTVPLATNFTASRWKTR
jgi:hypothetical protein